MRLVLDTNVFVSGVFFSGAPSEILESWVDGQFTLLMSPDILSEYARVVEELEEEYGPMGVTDIWSYVAQKALFVDPPGLPESVCRDPADDKFLACAIAGRCRLIISGDKHLLEIAEYQGVSIVRPREFADEYLQ